MNTCNNDNDKLLSEYVSLWYNSSSTCSNSHDDINESPQQIQLQIQPYGMCSKEECMEREKNNDVSIFEQLHVHVPVQSQSDETIATTTTGSTNSNKRSNNRNKVMRKIDTQKAISKYRRSVSNISDNNISSTSQRYPLRTIQQLTITVQYLLNFLFSSFNNDESTTTPTNNTTSTCWIDRVQFVQDRIRAIQVEISTHIQSILVQQQQFFQQQSSNTNYSNSNNNNNNDLLLLVVTNGILLRKIQYYITICHILILYFITRITTATTTTATTTTTSTSTSPKSNTTSIPLKFLYDAIHTSLTTYWSIPLLNNFTLLFDSNVNSDSIIIYNTVTIQYINVQEQMNDEMLSYFLLIQIKHSIEQQIQLEICSNANAIPTTTENFLHGIMSDFIVLYRRHCNNYNESEQSTSSSSSSSSPYLQWTFEFVSNLCCSNWYIALQMLHTVGTTVVENNNIDKEWNRFGIVTRSCLGINCINYIRYRTIEVYNISFMKQSYIDCFEIARLLFLFTNDDNDNSNNKSTLLSPSRAYYFGIACGLPSDTTVTTPNNNNDTKKNLRLQFKTAKVTLPVSLFVSSSPTTTPTQIQLQHQKQNSEENHIQVLLDDSIFVFGASNAFTYTGTSSTTRPKEEEESVASSSSTTTTSVNNATIVPSIEWFYKNVFF